MFHKRKDAKIIDKEIPVYNKMIPYLMKGRNESIITLSETLIMTENLKFTAKNKYSYFEIIIATVMKIMAVYPKMNCFIMDGHYYQRNEISCSFVIKTKLNIDSPERNVTIQCNASDNLASISSKIRVAVEKSKYNTDDEQEKAMTILFSFPSFIVKLVTSFLFKFDKLGLLPLSVTEFDSMHSSVFLANLGSIGIDKAPAHHLFEWGTCSLFITSGKIKKDQVVSKNGDVTIKDVLSICFSIDERIADGLYFSKVITLFKKLVENPDLLQ